MTEVSARAACVLTELTSGIRDLSDLINEKMAVNQYTLVEHIACDAANLGRGILVFVSGMPDIVRLSERFEERNKIKSCVDRYKVFVIHSDVPLEEQQEAFEPVSGEFVKVRPSFTRPCGCFNILVST